MRSPMSLPAAARRRGRRVARGLAAERFLGALALQSHDLLACLRFTVGAAVASSACCFASCLSGPRRGAPRCACLLLGGSRCIRLRERAPPSWRAPARSPRPRAAARFRLAWRSPVGLFARLGIASCRSCVGLASARAASSRGSARGSVRLVGARLLVGAPRRVAGEAGKRRDDAKDDDDRRGHQAVARFLPPLLRLRRLALPPRHCGCRRGISRSARNRRRSALPRPPSAARDPTSSRCWRAPGRKGGLPRRADSARRASTSRRQVSAAVISCCSHAGKLVPLADQALVADVDQRRRPQRRRPWRHQEIAARRAERFDDLAHRDLVAAGDRHELAELGRPPHRLRKARSGGQRAEDERRRAPDARAEARPRISRPCAASAPRSPPSSS